MLRHLIRHDLLLTRFNFLVGTHSGLTVAPRLVDRMQQTAVKAEQKPASDGL